MLNFFVKKNVLLSAVGFGIGGALWGLEAYRGTVGSGEVFTNPFSYILGAVALAVFGGLALFYISARGPLLRSDSEASGSLPTGQAGALGEKRWGAREGVKIIGLGLVGWLVAFLVPAVWENWILIFGGVIQPLLIILTSATNLDLSFVLNLRPSLVVAGLWFHFLLTGIWMGTVYAFILKTNIVKTALWAGIGFALAAIIGPILGNLIGNVFGSLLVSYLVTFLILGVTFGKFLILGMRRPS